MDDTIRSKHNQLTRDTIWSAYLDLLEQTPAEAIKVTDICRGAGISRGTFYRYYLDVADLTADVDGWYAALLTPYVERLFSTPERDRSVSLDILTQLMAQLAAHPKYCRVLLCTDRGTAARAGARPDPDALPAVAAHLSPAGRPRAGDLQHHRGAARRAGRAAAVDRGRLPRDAPGAAGLLPAAQADRAGQPLTPGRSFTQSHKCAHKRNDFSKTVPLVRIFHEIVNCIRCGK